MSEDTVELVRRAYELFNSEAFNRTEELDPSLFDPEVEIDRSSSVLDGAVYRGHAGLRDLVSLLREMWKRQRIEPQEFIPVGDDRVVVASRIVSVGREEIETVAHAATVWTVKQGRIARVVFFQSKDEALEAVETGAP
jgi:ketosteroid isomerase-like protein